MILTCFHSKIVEKISSGRTMKRPQHKPIKWPTHPIIDQWDSMLHENMPNSNRPQSLKPRLHECLDSQSDHNLWTNGSKVAATIKTRNYSTGKWKQKFKNSKIRLSFILTVLQAKIVDMDGEHEHLFWFSSCFYRL